tara:strand:- start:151 stop:552 length:402 start_codon:yes stop_codon:yes gene_type:complete
MKIGYKKEISFSFNQKQVIQFSDITKDKNPLHLDNNYASGTIFKKKILPGYLSASIFSRIFGTIFPGEGSIYLEQSLRFKKPMYVDIKYYAKIIVLDIDEIKNIFVIKTEIFEKKTDIITIEGKAKVMNLNIL